MTENPSTPLFQPLEPGKTWVHQCSAGTLTCGLGSEEFFSCATDDVEVTCPECLKAMNAA